MAGPDPPCGKDKDGDFLSYFGRGAKQLSYNYNYGPFSDAMYGDVRPLLDKPELVADTDELWRAPSSSLCIRSRRSRLCYM